MTSDRDVLTLARLARVLERACSDLTLAQYRLLALIGDGEERASRLAGQLALTKPTVSATVDTLVERGLVERASVDGDRRGVRLVVTTSGLAARRGAELAMKTQLDDVLARVADVAVLEEAFTQLCAALDERRDERRARRPEPQAP